MKFNNIQMIIKQTMKDNAIYNALLPRSHVSVLTMNVRGRAITNTDIQAIALDELYDNLSRGLFYIIQLFQFPFVSKKTLENIEGAIKNGNSEKLTTQCTQDQEKQNKCTTRYQLDITMRKKIQITQIRHESSSKSAEMLLS